MPAAASLLRRAAAARTQHDRERIRLLPDLGEALEELGQFEEAQRVLEEAITAARDVGDEALAAEAAMVLLSVRLYLGEEEGWADSVTREVAAAIPVFEAAGDHVGIARANRLLFAMHASANRLGDASRAAEQVIAHARTAGDLRIERRGALAYAQAALYGPTPVPNAIAEIEHLASGAEDDRRTRALLLTWLAQLYAMDGRLELARETFAKAMTLIADLREGEGSILRPSTELAQIELLGDEPRRAEAPLREDMAALQAIGERYILSGVIGILARVLIAQDRFDEVEQLSATYEEVAVPDDVAAQVDWRGLQALAIARSGQVEEAVRLAREGVELAEPADFLTLQAEAWLRLADVLTRAGNGAAATDAAGAARRLYEAKGDRVSAARIG
jgi:tetratricopeptide (TPR) repeat protein